MPVTEFEAFKAGEESPKVFEFGYAVLTEKAVANARNQIDAVEAKRAEMKKQEEEAAESRRLGAEERRQQAIAAAEAARKATEEKIAQEIARKDAAQKEVKAKLDIFVSKLNVAEANAYIENVNVSRNGDTWRATLTVKNIWHLQHYQLRLQAAQSIWTIWASIASPNNPDVARISLVDGNENEVGGSRFLAGSLIWVQEK